MLESFLDKKLLIKKKIALQRKSFRKLFDEIALESLTPKKLQIALHRQTLEFTQKEMSESFVQTFQKAL